MKNTTFIYALICPLSNNIRYIGKANNPKCRLSEHKRIRDNNSLKKLWIKSLIELKLSPILCILEEVNITEWKDKEKLYISKYKELGCDLLNICGGANGSYFGNKGSFNGSNSKKLVCLNKDGSYNKEYNSIKEAKNEYGSAISSVLQGVTKTAYGFIWVYKDGYEKMSLYDIECIVSNANNNMSKLSWKNGLINHQFKKGNIPLSKKCVHQYTLNGEFIKTWDSVRCATLSICEKEQSHISMAAAGTRNTAAGFKWSYKLL